MNRFVCAILVTLGLFWFPGLRAVAQTPTSNSQGIQDAETKRFNEILGIPQSQGKVIEKPPSTRMEVTPLPQSPPRTTNTTVSIDRTVSLSSGSTAAESERAAIEQAFAARRKAAYDLVRDGPDKLEQATEEMRGVLAMVQSSHLLRPAHREELIRTSQWDIANGLMLRARGKL